MHALAEQTVGISPLELEIRPERALFARPFGAGIRLPVPALPRRCFRDGARAGRRDRPCPGTATLRRDDRYQRDERARGRVASFSAGARRRPLRLPRALLERRSPGPLDPNAARTAPAAPAHDRALAPAGALRPVDHRRARRARSKPASSAEFRCSIPRAVSGSRRHRPGWRRLPRPSSAGSGWRPSAPRRWYASAERSISSACAASPSSASRPPRARAHDRALVARCALPGRLRRLQPRTDGDLGLVKLCSALERRWVSERGDRRAARTLRRVGRAGVAVPAAGLAAGPCSAGPRRHGRRAGARAPFARRRRPETGATAAPAE